MNDSGLRFSADVPVTVITVDPPELSGPDADQYDIIAYKTSHRLAQWSCSHEVLAYQRPVLKQKDTGKLITTPAPFNVLDHSVVDVSFLAGMLVDKFLYHLPLHRQHQRLKNGGVALQPGDTDKLHQAQHRITAPHCGSPIGSHSRQQSALDGRDAD